MAHRANKTDETVRKFPAGLWSLDLLGKRLSHLWLLVWQQFGWPYIPHKQPQLGFFDMVGTINVDILMVFPGN